MVHSVGRGSVISEYSVSGTTYAPEGVIFDGTGMLVTFFCILFFSGDMNAYLLEFHVIYYFKDEYDSGEVEKF